MKGCGQQHAHASLGARAILVRVFAVALLLMLGGRAMADSQTWNGAPGVNWGDPASWLATPIPGFSDGTTNTDVATFGAIGVGAVDLGTLNWTLGTVAVTNPTGGFTFGNGGLDLNFITLANTGGVVTFNTPLTDQNNDGISISSSVAQAGTTLTLSGANVTSGVNAIVGTTSIANRASFTVYGSNGALGGFTTSGTYSILGGVYFNSVNTTGLLGTWNVGGAWLIDNGGATSFLSGGSYTIAGDLQTTTSVLNIATGSTVSVGGNLIAGAVTSGVGTNGPSTINIGQALTNLGGTVQIAGGTVNVNASNPFFSTAKVIEMAPSTAASQATQLTLATTLTLDNAINVGTGAGATTIQGAANSVFGGAITLAKSVNLNSTGTAASFNGVISGAGASVTINNGTTGVVALTNANTFGGAGSNVILAGGLVRIAANTALGDAANGINFNGGGIQFNTTSFDVTAAGRALTFNAAKTVTIDTNGVATTTFANSFGGSTSAAFTKAGAGTLILSTAETYSGLTTVSAGTLQSATASNGFGTGSSISLGGGTLALRSNTPTAFGSTSAAGGYNLTLTATSTVDVNNNGANTGNTLSLGTVTIGVNTFNVTGGSSYVLAVAGMTQSAAGTTILSPTTANLQLGGFTSFTSGASTLSFRQTGTTTVTGAIVNGGGTLNIDRSNNPGTTIIAAASPNFGTGTIAVTQGTLQTAIMTNAFGNASAINMGGGTLALRLDNNATFGNGTTAYAFATTASTNLNIAQASSGTSGAAVTIGTLSFGSSHVVTVTGANGLGLTVGAITNNYAGGGTTNGFANAIAAGGTLTLGTVAYANIGANTNFTLSGAGKTTINGGISVTAGSGVLSLVYSGTNTLTLNAASSYTGTTTVSNAAGIIAIANNSALGTGAGNLILSSSTAIAVGNRSIANGLQVSGSTKIDAGGDLIIAGGFSNLGSSAATFTINNNTTFNTGKFVLRADATSALRTATVGGSGNLTINSVVANGNLGVNDNPGTTTFFSNLIYAGTGSLRLNGANTYQGNTTVTQGTLYLGGNAPVGNNTITSDVSGISGVLGNTNTAVALGSGSLTGGVSVFTTGAYSIDRAITETAVNNASFTIGGIHTTGTSSYAGTITTGKATSFVAGTGGQVNFATINGGTFAINIGAGGMAGTVKFGGTATTTGAVNLSFGKLIVDGGIAGGGVAGVAGVTVASGTTLAGAGGAITKALSISSGGHLAPGSTTNFGILTITGAITDTATPTAAAGSLNFAVGGNFDVNLAGTTAIAGTDYDQLNLVGNADLGGANLNVSVSSLTLGENQFFTLIANDGADTFLNTFQYAQDAIVLTQGGYDLKISYVGEGNSSATGGNDLVLYTSAVPEPASFASVAMVLVLLGKRRRARKSV